MTSMFSPWVGRMALRDGRRGLRPLLLSMCSAVLAVASVVVAFSFRENVQSSIREQAKSLLGADLALGSREAFSPQDEALFRSLGGEQSRQISFSSMIYFPESGGSRLVEVRALAGRFPYYGALETEPALAIVGFHGGANALVDENVLLQFNAQVGDRVKIGDHEFRIAGRLCKIPGESLAFSLLSPRVYIPMEYLDRTRLVQKGSLVRYRVFFKFDPDLDVDALVVKLSEELRRLDLDADTVSRRTAAIASATENLSRYLRLALFVAVLLAGVGIASVVHAYSKAKAHSVALLRCLGAAPAATVSVYLLQVFVLTAAGSLVGAALGALAGVAMPYALKDFLPVATAVAWAPAGIGAGLVVGLGTASLFAAMPLLPLRRISPLAALRAAVDAERPPRDGLIGILGAAILCGVGAFAVVTTGNWRHGLWFTGGVLVVFIVLLALARAASALMRKLAPKILSFPWRQGLANLYRPNNQTHAVTLAIGLSTFLLVTVASVQSTLVAHVARLGDEGESNLVLFDVQPDQRAGLRDLMASLGVSVQAEVPIVTLRLAAVKGKAVAALRADPGAGIPGWALRREYRSTYRSAPSGTEKIIQGIWHGEVAAGIEPVPVSVEKSIADTLRVGLGDELRFEIQGVPVATRIASIREVDWQRLQPNFFVVFPSGAIDDAPRFYAVAGRAPSSQASADLQRAIVERFPNVSAIDLSLILATLNAILAKVAAAIRVVAAFILATCLTVLASAVLGSRAQRAKEAVLLRTLGAPRGQILCAVVAEYLFLGATAGAAGAILGVAATGGLALYFFDSPAAISMAPVGKVLLAIVSVTVLTGALGSLNIFRRSPLEALRAEA